MTEQFQPYNDHADMLTDGDKVYCQCYNCGHMAMVPKGAAAITPTVQFPCEKCGGQDWTVETYE